MLDREEIKQLVLLCDSYMLSALDDQDRLDLAVSGEPIAYPSGEVIVRQGDPGDAFYLVKAGRVRVSAQRDGTTSELAVLGRGMCFGEMALLCGTPRSATVSAAEACEVVRYRKADLDAVLARNPPVRQALDVLARRRASRG